MDATGSMASWIRTVCERLKSTLTDVKHQYPGVNVHTGVVAYRDYEDDPAQTLDLTKEYNQFTSFLDRYRSPHPKKMCCTAIAAFIVCYYHDVLRRITPHGNETVYLCLLHK